MPTLRSPTLGPLAVGLALAVGVVATTALATPPGKNGKIVFRRYLSADHSAGALFVANPDGSGVTQLTHPAAGRVVDNEPDWSPDGTQVVFQRADENACGDDSCESDQIWVVNADGSNAHAIAADPAGKSCATNNKPGGGICRFSPAWSPDGTRIIFACTTPFIPGYLETGGLCVVNADGSSLTTLIHTPKRFYDDGPQFSPNGKQIAFERDLDGADGSTMTAALFVMHADGTNIHRVTPLALRGGDHPDWSPDGKRILFTSNVDGPDAISANKYTVKPDGTGLRQLTHARGGTTQWMSSSYSPDGQWITVARRSGAHNAQVYVIRTDGTGARNITHSTTWDSAPDWGATH
jgi:TolB protein